MKMAAYIDLNPIRAGMVEKPEDYRWCGYAEAFAGKATAQRSLKAVVETHQRIPMTNDSALAKYRALLYGDGEAMQAGQNGESGRKGVSRERVQEVIQAKGKLSSWEMLRCKMRYFTDGVALGTKEFINQVFDAERHRFGPKRETGARTMRHVDAGELRTLRNLRIDPVG